MRKTLAALSLVFALLFCGVASAQFVVPPGGGGGGGGAAYVQASITTGSIAASGSETGDEALFFDEGIIALVQVASTVSACVTVEFYADDGYATLLYQLTAVDGNTATYSDRGGAFPYEDADTTAELHWKVINCGGSATVVTLTVGGIGE